VLVRMDAVQTKAAADITMSQYISARAAEARLIAERDGKSSITFPKELAPYKNDPRVVEAMTTQNQLFLSRRLSLDSELAALDENVAGLKMQLQGMQSAREAQKEQLEILKEQLVNMRDLAKDGYVARSRLLEIERVYSQINGQMAELSGNIGRGARQIAELNLKRTQRIQDQQREIRTNLAEMQKEADALSGRLVAETHALSNVEVKAPTDGVVLGMNIFTKGGVVPPGFKLMDVVPTADALVVEGQLPVNLVDKVHPGLPVDFIFSAFNVNTTPHIPGEVTSVSADRLVDEKTGMPYYKVLARVTPAGLKEIQRLKLEVRPGMPADMFVKTGERTMMNYLFRPILDRMKSAMKED
jgi:protease secretion system membrane fusion protein